MTWVGRCFAAIKICLRGKPLFYFINFILCVYLYLYVCKGNCNTSVISKECLYYASPVMKAIFIRLIFIDKETIFDHPPSGHSHIGLARYTVLEMTCFRSVCSNSRAACRCYQYNDPPCTQQSPAPRQTFHPPAQIVSDCRIWSNRQEFGREHFWSDLPLPPRSWLITALTEAIILAQLVKKLTALWENRKVRYRINESPPLILTLNQMNQFHNFPFCIFKILFHITLHLLLVLSVLSHASYMLPPPHPPSLDHANNI
jgi:hypothetical protein